MLRLERLFHFTKTLLSLSQFARYTDSPTSRSQKTNSIKPRSRTGAVWFARWWLTTIAEFKTMRLLSSTRTLLIHTARPLPLYCKSVCNRFRADRTLTSHSNKWRKSFKPRLLITLTTTRKCSPGSRMPEIYAVHFASVTSKFWLTWVIETSIWVCLPKFAIWYLLRSTSQIETQCAS
jgi:hypothetical protein